MTKYTEEYLNACIVHNYRDRKTIYPPTIIEILTKSLTAIIAASGLTLVKIFHLKGDKEVN